MPLDLPAPSGFGFVAVHVGSGCHSRTREKLYLEGELLVLCTVHQAVAILTKCLV